MSKGQWWHEEYYEAMEAHDTRQWVEFVNLFKHKYGKKKAKEYATVFLNFECTNLMCLQERGTSLTMKFTFIDMGKHRAKPRVVYETTDVECAVQFSRQYILEYRFPSRKEWENKRKNR